MKIKHALITAAGPDHRRLPLQYLTDRTGAWKAAIAIQIQEIFAAGIERVGVVIKPTDRPAYENILACFGNDVVLLEQSEPNGYGCAVMCGREFTAKEPFLLQVSDHLYVSHDDASCTRQLLDIAEENSCAVSAVQATHERHLQSFGTVAGSLVSGRKGIYIVEHVVEKPTPTVAEQTCTVPGLRGGHYLCFFGMHVLTTTVFDLLDSESAASPNARLGLSPSLARLATREKYLAAELNGRRVDLETQFGVLRAQIALGLNGPARSELLAVLTEELANDACRH